MVDTASCYDRSADWLAAGGHLWTLRRPLFARLGSGALLLVGGVYGAKYGQTAFVSSYAEGAFAGKL